MQVQAVPPPLCDVQLQHEIEQFYYWEADLLDSRRYDEWLDLLADECEYWMPVRSTRVRGDEEHEFAKPGEGAFFDDEKAHMVSRVEKLYTGFAWAEDPPSRTRHFVGNVRILEQPADATVRVASNFLVYRTRLAKDEDEWVGRREDTLRKVDGRWKIAKRHIFLDQVVLTSKNLSVFF
jgi:3-phenylpropionate/cinnamic acid dioxygenase small subunit